MDDVWEDFEDSGLDWTVDREFVRTYLPNSYTSVGYDKHIAKELAQDRGVKNPKPDRTYGFAVNTIPRPQGRAALLRDTTKALLNAIPGLQHAFFFIEGISSAGSMVKAINQACRIAEQRAHEEGRRDQGGGLVAV